MDEQLHPKVLSGGFTLIYTDSMLVKIIILYWFHELPSPYPNPCSSTSMPVWHIRIRTDTGPWFNIKMSSYQYRKSHCGDKMVVRSSYLHNGISYTGKMSSLYWIGAQLIAMGCSRFLIHTSTMVCYCNYYHLVQTKGLKYHNSNMQICIPYRATLHISRYAT